MNITFLSAIQYVGLCSFIGFCIGLGIAIAITSIKLIVRLMEQDYDM